MKTLKFASSQILLICLLLLIGCLDDNGSVTTNWDPEVTFKVSGSAELEFKAQGTVSYDPDDNATMFGSFATIDGKKYGFSLKIFFKNAEKKDTIPFVNTDVGNEGNFAIAAFQIGDGEEKKVFISYDGKIIIDDMSGSRLFGSFYFLAKENATTLEISVTEGTLRAWD